jgi:hypothetical protein
MHASLEYKTSSFFLSNVQHQALHILPVYSTLSQTPTSTQPLCKLIPTSTMRFLYTILPILPLAAANGRVHFNAYGEPNCQGFEETYSLNPAPVKGNFPGKAQQSWCNHIF